MLTFLNSAEDMQWLKDVHVRILPDNARSAIIFGNEDAPDSIEVYDSAQPLVTDTPIMLCSAEFLSYAARLLVYQASPIKSYPCEFCTQPSHCTCKISNNGE